MLIKNIVIVLFSIAIFSGCGTYKVQLVSQKDNSVHNGTMSDMSDTFNIKIRDDNYIGDWSIGHVEGTSGGLLKQRGTNGGYLSCQFTLGNSVEYGECEERTKKEKFDMTIK